MRRALCVSVLAVAAIVLTQRLDASLIRYVESGQLSGTLGSTALTHVPFTFTFIGDTNNIIVDMVDSIFLNPAVSNTIVIGGSTGIFTSAVDAGVNSIGGIIGFSDPTVRAFGISFVNAGAVGYDLATSIGPLTSSTVFLALGSASTSLGTLTLNPQGAQNLSFTATVIPEPKTIGFSALVLLGIITAGVRKDRRVSGLERRS